MYGHLARYGAMLLIAGFFSTGIRAAEEGGGVDKPDLKGMAEMIRAKNDYKRVLIEARLADAEIELKASETALNWTKVAHLKLFMEAMRHELDRVRHEEWIVKQAEYQIRQQADLVAPLADGDTSTGAFRGLRYFRRYLVSLGLQKELLFKAVEPLDKSQFIPNDGVSEPVDFPGGNVGKLIQFAEQHDYSFAPWEKAHFFVMDFLDTIAKSVHAKIQEYRTYIDGIRAGTLNVWQLPNE